MFDKTNKVSPIKDGELFLIAKVKDKKSRSTIKILEAQEKRPFSFIALGGSSNGATLEGHSYTYVGSTWGRIVDILMESILPTKLIVQ